MNIEQANAIPLPEILQKMGAKLAKQKGSEIWYHSPFREEKTASLHVNVNKNIWYDFGAVKGGKVICLVIAYLESHGEDYTAVDALRWVRNMTSFMQPARITQNNAKTGQTLRVLQVQNLQHTTLIKYLKSRGISFDLAKNYLSEVLVHNANTGKQFFAFGLRTENKGYELRNKVFKGSIGGKSISFIRGSEVPAKEIHVFEGMMDFLAALQSKEVEGFTGDVIVLNSVSNIHQAFPYLKNYGYSSLYSWLDNDEAGLSATNTFKEFAEKEGILTFQEMNKTYSPHKDVNLWLKNRP